MNTVFTFDPIPSAYIKRMQRDRVYKPHQLSELIGEYELIQTTPYFKRGAIFKNPEGWLHGIWHPEKKELLRFDNTQYFLPI